MKLLLFIANLPWTILGLAYAMVSIPSSSRIEDWAIIIRVRSLTVPGIIQGFRNSRGMAVGHVVLATPQASDADIRHDIIHVEQHHRLPFIFPFLYAVESWRHGYGNNRFEKEAYRRAGNTYNNPYKS